MKIELTPQMKNSLRVAICNIDKNVRAERASELVGDILAQVNSRFDALEQKLERVACVKDAPADISGEHITMPYSRLTDEQIVAAIDHELDMNARNDTLATDRIERLASRIEFYGRTDEVFAEKHRYWKARVAYLRHGDFPNPGIDRNGATFTAILKECADMIRPPQEKGEPIQVEAED